MRKEPHPRSSVLSQYFSEIREFPLLTRAEEKGLARDIQAGSRDALEQLVKSNLSFVAKIASEYRNLGIPFEDLLNEGNLGLIEAAQRFNPDKNNKFISYAIWWIRKAILKALCEKAHVVRMPYSQIKKFKEIRKAEQELQRSLGRSPTRDEISSHLSRCVSKVDKVLQYGVHETSLDIGVGENQETPLADVLADERCNSPEERLLDVEKHTGLGEVYRELTEQQKTVIAYRYGVHGEPPLTLQETGERIGVSRERVRQIENQAKERMRRLFRKKRRIGPPACSVVRSVRSRKSAPTLH
ncbi:MAG: sigma-70 family RNA polymerase sigma factor [Planctomycetota bacterium]|jgi:RNA polymerase primary sigma factor